MSDRIIGIPNTYYMGGHGDPVAQFDRTALILHDDGSVSWCQTDAAGNVIAGCTPENVESPTTEQKDNYG